MPPIRSLARLLALLLPAVALSAYLLAPYAALRDGYLRLTPDLYRAAAWPTAFFTPVVKAQGNVLALLGLAGLAGVAGGWGWLRRKQPAPSSTPSPTPSAAARLGLASWGFGRADGPWLAGLLALAAGLWGCGFGQVPPAYDEVFSAVYCAGSGSVLAAWSYYVLPNNHVLFNVLNGAVFGPWLDAPGLLLAGRGLSGLAYVGTVAVVYGLGRRWTGRRWGGAGLAGLAATQFSLWGFGFQARGYALYALLHWMALAALLGYWRGGGRRGRWLACHAGAVVAGYATVPTFVFFHAATVLVAGGRAVRQRRWDGRFWLAQAGIVLGVGLFYFPALGFSGVSAFVANAYTRPGTGGAWAFLVEAWPVLATYAGYCFGDFGWGPWPAYGLAALPLGLLGSPRHRALGWLYLAWVLVLLAGTAGLRRVVFHRNLLALLSVALVLAPVAVGAALGRWRRWAGAAGAVGLGAVLVANFVRHNPVREAAALYYYDLPGAYEAARQRVATLPAGADVAFSEESFYPYFLYVRAGGRAAHPARRPPPPTDFRLTAANDSLPTALAGRYVPLDTVADYRLWQRTGSGW